MKHFLRHLPDGGGATFNHFAAAFAGAQELSNLNSGGNLSPVGGFSIEFSFWVKFNHVTPGEYQKIIHMGDGAVGTDVLGCQLDGPTSGIVVFSSNGAAYSNVAVPGFVAVPNQWYWVWGECGGAANMIEIYIGGTVSTPGGSAGSSGVQVINKPLYVGAGPAVAFPLDGDVDSLGIWPRGTPAAINAGDFAALRNNGKAPNFNELPSTVNLAAWYDFNNVTKDSADSNDLTMTGTVTRVKGAGF